MYTRHSRVTRPSTALAVGLVVASAACAKTVPAELPRPDDTPPASDKPVRVYIISGQSNSLGFGRVEGGDPPYRSIFLSADPRVEPARMPVGDAALLPHRVYTSAEGDEAGARASVYKGSLDAGADSDRLRPIEEATVPLGDVTATLPSTPISRCR